MGREVSRLGPYLFDACLSAGNAPSPYIDGGGEVKTKFASQTTVPVEKSRSEIEAVLARYGANQFGYASDSIRGLASIQFRERRFMFTATNKRRTDGDQLKVYEQACRQRWRSLLLCIRAKLEAVESGISEFETEFMAHIVLPSNQTVGEFMLPQIANAYQTGEQPLGIAGLLPAPKDGK